MAINRSRLASSLIAVGSISAAIWMNPLTASADAADDLYGPLVTSSCTAKQLDEALSQSQPQLAQQLNQPDPQHQQAKKQVEAFFHASPSARRSMVNQAASTPQGKQALQNNPAIQQVRQASSGIASTCQSLPK